MPQFDIRQRAALQHCTVLAWFRASATLEMAVLDAKSLMITSNNFILTRFFPDTGGFDWIERSTSLDVIQAAFIGKLAGLGISSIQPTPEHEAMAETDR